MDALAAGGAPFNRFHVTSLCSPTRASFFTGRNHHAVGMGFLADIPLAFPGYHARLAEDGRRPPAPVARRRVLHAGRRQVAPDAPLAALGRRALRHLAARPRLRALLRLPPGRHQPLGTEPGLRQPLHRAAASARGRVPPERGPGRPGRPHGPGPAAGRTRQALLLVLRPRRDARPAPCRPRVGRPVPGRVRQGMGRLAGGAVRAPGRVRRRARGHRAHGAARMGAGLDRPLGGRAAPARPPAGGLRRLPDPHRCPDRPHALVARDASG